MNTRDQLRAQGAFVRVTKIAGGQDSKLRDDYNSLCRKLPSLLQQCGLCQTVAFLQAKGAKGAHARVLADLAEVVLDSTQNADTTLAQKARSAELREYQWLTRNTLQCSNWFKRYAEALLGEPAE